MFKLKIVALIISLLIILISAYAFLISLSEDRVYSKHSIDYLFLTPTHLAQLSKLCASTAQFTYSSADGPKPAITSLSCELDEAAAFRYLTDNKFRNEGGIFKKESIEIDIQKSENQKLNKVTLLEYL